MTLPTLAMRQHLPTTPPLEPENKCLGCLFMKLEGIPVQPEKQEISKQQPQSAATEQLNLYLTLQFKEQRELLLGGRFKFGLKGGKLSLKLENCEFPLESRHLSGFIKLIVQQERQQQQGNENQSRREPFLPENKPTVQGNLATQKTTERTDKFQFIVCQVTTNNSEENPAWVFEVETDEAVLKGILNKAKLGTLNVTAKPCRVEATFEVSPQDVYMTEAEGLWPKNISKKRKAVIERAIIRHLIERKLKPYLSRQELRYE